MGYPKSVAFIISNEFCERFCFYGLRAILVLYLTRKLHYDDDDATIAFHVFTSLAYFFPILGAIVADSWLGRFRTIMYLSVVYMVGSVIIAIGAIPQLQLPANAVTIIGLLLIALGTGGIKPCVAAFGGDQFKVPEQAKQLAVFFSLFYMSINAGSLLSTLITPILREDVHCFGDDTCFSLAFGVPGALMVVSIFIFFFGRPFYNITNPSGNMLVMVSKCCYNAIRTRAVERRIESTPRAHWLDYAKAKYGPQLVNDVKVLLRILLLYVPLPIFWALFDQQGSRWTFQASRMNGEVGAVTIKPDQMQVVNPVMIIAFIPLWDAFVYPLLERIGVRRPLQKLTIGMGLVALAFLMSAVLELLLESLDPVRPGPTEAQLRIVNGVESGYQIRVDHSDLHNLSIDPMSLVERRHVRLQHAEAIDFTAHHIGHPNATGLAGVFNLQPAQAMTYFITNRANRTQIVSYVDEPGKPTQDLPLLRVLVTSLTTDARRKVVLRSHRTELERVFGSDAMELTDVSAGRYDVFVDKVQVDDRLELATGGVYMYLVSESPNGQFKTALHTIVQPNSIHILWQLPQYVVVTAAEIMFSVTGLEFSFTEAPDSMKSVLQACWLLTVTVGNIFVVFIAHMHFFDQQSSEFLLFAGLMVIDTAFFIWLAMGYQYNNGPDAKEKEAEASSTATTVVMAATDRKQVVGVENIAYVNDQ